MVTLTATTDCQHCIGGKGGCPCCGATGRMDREQRVVCQRCGGSAVVVCNDCDGSGRRNHSADVPDDWHNDRELLHTLAAWMERNGEKAEAIVYMLEKPWKWKAELVLAINGVEEWPLYR